MLRFFIIVRVFILMLKIWYSLREVFKILPQIFDFIRSRERDIHFSVYTFLPLKKILVSCLIHFGDVLCFDEVKCLQYNRQTYFSVQIDDAGRIYEKCLRCYRRTALKLLKHVIHL